MADDKGIARAYSQDRQIYRNDLISIKRKTSTQITRTTENYYSNRNCPEILSLFAITNKQLDNRKNQIYHSTSNDTHYFNMINYQIQSPPATPILNLVLENDNQQDKQTKFPKVTSKISRKPFEKMQIYCLDYSYYYEKISDFHTKKYFNCR